MASSSSAVPGIGIDLGTTFSCVGVLINGKVQIIPNQQGRTTIPSWVSFSDNERHIGERAKNLAVIDPENTVSNVKRLIGRNLDEENVQSDLKYFPFKVVDGGSGNPKIQVKYKGQNKQFRPEEISAMVLGELKAQAEEHLGMQVKDAVITVPAYFTDAQRQATQDAGKIAGLNVLGIINEPTAAALAYGFDNSDREGKTTVLVYDFGGGTFDVSILDVTNGQVEVLSTGGNPHLGGEDIDNILVEHFCEEFKKQRRIDILDISRLVVNDEKSSEFGKVQNAKKAVRRLRVACEKAKIQLSTKRSGKVDIPNFWGEDDLQCNLTRAFFEKLCEDLFRQTLVTVTQTLENSNSCIGDIQEIILVGGSTRIPMVQSMLTEVFNGKNPYETVNPDEAVAYGAAIQVAILKGVDPQIVRNVQLRDVTPMSLGIETFGGVMATIIKRNTPVPIRRSKVFSTSKDNQTSICFQVFEGERHMTKYNNLLGEFTLVGIPPAPRRIPQIDVSFHVDANGILKVSAVDLGTEWENSIQITNDRGRLNSEQIQDAIRVADEMRAHDLKLKGQVQSREKLEVYATKIEGSLKNPRLREKLAAEELRRMTEKLDESLRLCEKDEEPENADFSDAYSQLSEIWTPIVKRCYGIRKQTNSDAPVLHEEETFDSFVLLS